MIVHQNLELLSSFVDGELEEPLREAVELHLADCQQCRDRLGGLRRVVDELRGLELVAPPNALAARVRRAVLFDRRGDSGVRRSAESLRRWIQQPLLLPFFGVVTAMAILLYLFTVWSDQPATRLIVGSGEELPVEVVRRVGDRSFERIGGLWVEEGVEPGATDRRIELERPDPAHDILEPFRVLGGRVVLRHRGEVVEVVFGR